jgi:xanthine dehydrogenase accessory factor
MHELIPDLIRWHSKNEQVGLAMVLQTWGSAPRPPGACMAFTSNGEFSGSVSGGCVENAVIETGLEVLQTGQAQLLPFKVTDEQAWDVGLSCGGSLEVFVTVFDPKMIGKVIQVIQESRKATWITCVRGSQTSLGKQMLSLADGALFGNIDPLYQAQLEALASETLRSGSTTRRFLDNDHEVFVQVLQPPPRLIVIGGVHIAQALMSLAKVLGYRTILLDPRSVWNNLDRFPNVDQLIHTWPTDGLLDLGIDSQTAVVSLSHDPKLDDPAIQIALASPAFYIGALGSRSTQANRMSRLRTSGLSEAALSRLHAPIGLEIGASNPAEIAIAIMAEIVQAYRSPADSPGLPDVTKLKQPV